MSKTAQPLPFNVEDAIHIKAGALWRYGKVIEDCGGTVVRIRIGGYDMDMARGRVFLGGYGCSKVPRRRRR